MKIRCELGNGTCPQNLVGKLEIKRSFAHNATSLECGVG